MEVKQKGDKNNGIFYIEEAGKQVAKMSYVFAGDTKFIIDHTEVDPAFEGKGLGRKLVQAGVDFARTNGYKILPLCPYAKKVFGQTPGYSDVLF
jgi:uncharacterized protein